jgi:hypothetical protein
VPGTSFAEGEFTEGHELPGKWQVPKEMIGRRLSQEEAKRLLAKFNPPSSTVTDFDRVIDQPADLKSNTDTAAIASSHRTTTAAMYSIHSLLSENHP